MAKAYNKDHPDALTILGEAMTTEPYAFAFAFGSEDLVAKINDVLHDSGCRRHRRRSLREVRRALHRARIREVKCLTLGSPLWGGPAPVRTLVTERGVPALSAPV